jgi:hypothetical protein
MVSGRRAPDDLRSPAVRNLVVAIPVTASLVFLLEHTNGWLAHTHGWPARGSPLPAALAEEPLPEAADAPPAGEAAPEPGEDLPPPDPVVLFDSDEVTRLLRFVLDPADRAEEHLEDRGRAANGLRAIVERGGLPLVHEAFRRMQDPVGDRHRAQLLLALATEVPPELLDGLRGSADPLVLAYADLRAEASRAPDTVGDGGALGDAPLLDVAEDVRTRLWPDPEPSAETWTEEAFPEWEAIRSRLLVWWREIPPEDRFLLADDELLVVARDVAKTWVIHNWRFVMLLGRRDGRWHVRGFHRPDTKNELVERVHVADLDGDGRKEGAVWTTITGGWISSRLVVVGSGAPHGVVTKHVYGTASGIRLLPPRRPGDPARFGVSDVLLPSDTGKWGYLVGVIARECELLEWTGSGFRSLGAVYLPLG